MRFFCVMMLGWSLTAAAVDSADDDAAIQAEALSHSQSVLKDPSKRKAAAGKDADALGAMQALEKLAGNPQNSQKMYELAAELMQTLTQLSGGDPEKMMKILEAGKQNPDAFGKNLTPEQRKKLSELAKALETPSRIP